MSDVTMGDATRCAQSIVDRVGNEIRLAVPIGIGKPVLLLNALYRLAEADRRITLSIFTGLTLARPPMKSVLEQRFVGPLLDRVLGSTPEPLYVAAQRAGRLPANISVHEFFLQAGVWNTNKSVQRSYTSLNYAHVAQHLRSSQMNVFAQLVAPPRGGGQRVSLGGNTDVTLDMLDYIAERRRTGNAVVVACEVNAKLPYMLGEAEIDLAEFDVCLEPPGAAYDLFAVPKQPVSLQDYAKALYAATLVRDGGTLQIGIGTFGDALTHALILRHARNDVFRALIAGLGGPRHPDALMAPFETGLYGCTEMLVDGYLALMRAGILKRHVVDASGARSILDAGFFVGNDAFYQQLRDMPEAQLSLIRMRGIAYTNTLSGDTAGKCSVRVDARFINTALTVTLLGAVSSDATAGGHVVSGVGGQLDLVLQAHQLADARAIIVVRSTRRARFKTSSNVVWSYANCTVPRSLRDIVVSEYGIADVKGKSDRDTIAAMIGIADGAFQQQLVAAAIGAGKLEETFRLPSRENNAECLEAVLAPFRSSGALPLFPLGTEMTAIEQALVEPLADLRTADFKALAGFFLHRHGPIDPHEISLLQRVGLDDPRSWKDWALRRLLIGAIRGRARSSRMGRPT